MNDSQFEGFEGMDSSTRQPVRINYRDLTDVVCDNCKDQRFEPVYLLKRASPLVSPTGKELIVAMAPPLIPQIFACYSCGHINEAFLPAPLRASMKNTSDGIKSSDLSGPQLIK